MHTAPAGTLPIALLRVLDACLSINGLSPNRVSFSSGGIRLAREVEGKQFFFINSSDHLMEVTLRQLRAFVALADTGSFTRAAETLCVTQSALSGLIRELESQLEVQLVDRSTRRNRLSDVGREFYDVAHGVLRELDRALEHIDDLRRLRRGIVRVATPQLMASTLMPAAVAAFNRTHPQIEVYLADCPVEEVIKRVVMGQVDFGIGPQRSVPGALTTTPFIASPFIAVFPDGHPLQRLKQVRWQDLARYPLILLKGEFADQLGRDLFEAVDPDAIRPRHEVTFMSTALSLVNAGMGVSACLPYAQPLIDLYRLQARPLVEPEVRRHFFIYTRRYAHLSPAAEVFISALRAGTTQFDAAHSNSP